MLNEKEVLKSAQQHWSALVPAILEYEERQKGVKSPVDQNMNYSSTKQ